MDYASDLNSADYNTLDDRLAKFCHFCSTDSVFSNIDQQLRHVASSGFDSWYAERSESQGGMSGSGQLIFPLEDETRIAFMYELLFRIQSANIKIWDFCINFFSIRSNSLDDYLYAFNEAITGIMIRDIGYKLEEMLEEMEESDEGFVSAASIQIIHNAENVIQQTASGSNITQSASIENNPELGRLFEELRLKVGNKPDDVDIIAAAESEAKKTQPKKPVVQALLNGLSIAASAAGIIASIVAML